MRKTLIEQGGIWDLQVQLCTDLERMPIEDSTVVWDEEQSPYRSVATLEIPPQISWQDGVSQKTEDELLFSPWHGLAAHQPLGGVNRARKDPYKFSADYRAKFNGCPIHEPRGLSELSS